MQILGARFIIILSCFYISVGAFGAELEHESELYTGPEYKNAFKNPKDNPDLPNVLLIGDSISIGYTIEVRKKLSGKADVFRIPTNGRYAAYGVEQLNKWLTEPKIKWDVIHFNWGLWDICYRHPDSKVQGNRDKINGTLTATPEQYQENMTKAVAILKTTGAKLIWCATTPVPENEAGRIQGDEVKYNAIAENIMKENAIHINDLYSHCVKKTPGIYGKPGDVHFTKEGYAYLAEQVTHEIVQVLEKK